MYLDTLHAKCDNDVVFSHRYSTICKNRQQVLLPCKMTMTLRLDV